MTVLPTARRHAADRSSVVGPRRAVRLTSATRTTSCHFPTAFQNILFRPPPSQQSYRNDLTLSVNTNGGRRL